MRRYYFHLWTGSDYQYDDYGSDLESAEAAYFEAFEAAQEMAIDMIRDRRNAATHRLDVFDEDGRPLFDLPFTEVLGARPNGRLLPATLERGRALASEVACQVSAVREGLRTLRTLIEDKQTT